MEKPSPVEAMAGHDSALGGVDIAGGCPVNGCIGAASDVAWRLCGVGVLADRHVLDEVL